MESAGVFIMKIKQTMNIFSILFTLFFFTNCATKNKTAVRHNSQNTDTKDQTSPPAKKVTVAGTITQTFSYCGGAAPPQFLLEEMATPKPFSKKKLVVIKGDTNTTAHQIILNFISDSLGNFSFQLEPGIYSVILEEQVSPPDVKKYKTETQTIDESCYKKWWATPYYPLEIPALDKPATIKGLNFNFHHRCFISSDVPCLQYDGPMPP
jgi:hypothetical protein